MRIVVILYLSFSLHVIVSRIMENYFERYSETKESKIMLEKRKPGEKKGKNELIPGLR